MVWITSFPAMGQEQASVGQDIVVTVDGMAACPAGQPSASARHAALADALRRAVEKAVGVRVEGDTRTKNYALTRDTIRTTSEGFVRDYSILEEGAANGMYRVKIQATVAPGKPEKSLQDLCKQLRSEINPAFVITVTNPAGRTLSNAVAALGLRVVTAKTSKSIIISGKVMADPLGEAVSGSKIYSANAAANLSVKDAASGTIIPSVGVSLPQPVVGVSRSQANGKAADAACRLWIERNIPIIATSLLDPGKPVDLKAGSDSASYGAAGSGSTAPSESSPVTVVPSRGSLEIGPDAMNALASKLKTSVEKSVFAPAPVSVAIAGFKGIGTSDKASVEAALEDLSTALVKTGVFQLVERSELDKVLRELRIQNSGLIDSSTARKLGKLVGSKSRTF
jgi:hypothetical protein